MSNNELHGADHNLGFPTSALARSLALVLTSASLFAGLTSCAPRSPSDFAQFQSCSSARVASFSPVLPTPGNPYLVLPNFFPFRPPQNLCPLRQSIRPTPQARRPSRNLPRLSTASGIA